MYPAPIQPLAYSMREIFTQLKNNQSLPIGMGTLEAYYFCKAHKLVAYDHFIGYWRDGRSKQPLRDILAAHYPPLEYGHKQEDGFVGLTAYVNIAKEVFGV